MPIKDLIILFSALFIGFSVGIYAGIRFPIKFANLLLTKCNEEIK